MMLPMLHDLRRLYLVRHGETDWNREGRLQGLTDSPLNDRGRVQARALAERLRGTAIDGLYASPLVRAAETAEIVAPALGCEPVHLRDLRERDVGVWGGLTYEDVKVRYPDEWARAAVGEDLAVGGGETLAEVQARMRSALDAAAAPHAAGTILVISHGLALKTVFCHLLGLDLQHAERLTAGGNTGVTVFEMRRGLPRMTAYADASHLAAAVTASS